ncbi:MAG: NADH-quinone oxidoreductase subunit L [Clostridiales Family XIII bacterium]|nr:NADH-quinone oxidoreductase subunit L [Clostridiales Family XIII bacterium]
MGVIFLLILIPLIIAIVLLAVKSDRLRDPVVIASGIAIAAISIYFAVSHFGGVVFTPWTQAGGVEFFGQSADAGHLAEGVGIAMMVIEAALAVLIIYLGIKYKKALAVVLAAIQTPLLIWFEQTRGHDVPVSSYINIDNFSLIMILIIGVIGSMICIYSVGYMKDFSRHHAGGKDRRPFFFFMMFLFLAAMFGIVICNNMIWMYFFWEVTTLCSFFLIGYTKTDEAIRNSFRALIMNLLGGLAFVCAIIVMGNYFGTGTLELSQVLEVGVQYKIQAAAQGMANTTEPVVGLIATLLAFAGITKAAQMPFNSWLLGAMVAPTPTSALLHSSTMVKAGVFLIVKLAPVLGFNSAVSVVPGFIIGPGFLVTMVGGITFLFASMAALSQSNAKRVLAYSTVANLGLIVACAGIGTAEAVWAAIMLIIFHAVTKSLLFLCVGTVEHNIGSRDIEDMDGLFGRMPKLATFLIIGISAMFLAPFGMLISKWAALQSFIDSGDIWIILALVFGSAATLFYWTKWLGKMTAVVAARESIENKVHGSEWGILGGLAAFTVAVTVTFPFFSKGVVVPYLGVAFSDIPEKTFEALRMDNMIIMMIMAVLIIVLALLFYGRTEKRIVPLYMAGTNEGDNLTFTGAMQKDVPVSLRNWYLEEVFPEKMMNRIGVIATSVFLAITFSYVISISISLYLYIIEGGGV